LNVDENRRDSEIKSVAGSWHVTDDDVVTHPKRSPVGPLMPEASNTRTDPVTYRVHIRLHHPPYHKPSSSETGRHSSARSDHYQISEHLL
jgi:hypothetical protein